MSSKDRPLYSWPHWHKMIQVQFIDAGHQIWKLCKVYIEWLKCNYKHFPQTFIRTLWRCVKTLGQHQWMPPKSRTSGHNIQLWISTWCIFHKFHEMPGWRYPASLVNQNVIRIAISYLVPSLSWPCVHFGIKSWNLAHVLLDVNQIKSDIKHFYCISWNMQISTNPYLSSM